MKRDCALLKITNYDSQINLVVILEDSCKLHACQMKAKRLYIYIYICIISGPDEGRRQRRLAAPRIEEYHLKRL